MIKTGIKGEYRVVCRSPDGSTQDTGWCSNLITVNGIDQWNINQGVDTSNPTRYMRLSYWPDITDTASLVTLKDPWWHSSRFMDDVTSAATMGGPVSPDDPGVPGYGSFSRGGGQNGNTTDIRDVSSNTLPTRPDGWEDRNNIWVDDPLDPNGRFHKERYIQYFWPNTQRPVAFIGKESASTDSTPSFGSNIFNVITLFGEIIFYPHDPGVSEERPPHTWENRTLGHRYRSGNVFSVCVIPPVTVGPLDEVSIYYRYRVYISEAPFTGSFVYNKNGVNTTISYTVQPHGFSEDYNSNFAVRNWLALDTRLPFGSAGPYTAVFAHTSPIPSGTFDPLTVYPNNGEGFVVWGVSLFKRKTGIFTYDIEFSITAPNDTLTDIPIYGITMQGDQGCYTVKFDSPITRTTTESLTWKMSAEISVSAGV